MENILKNKKLKRGQKVTEFAIILEGALVIAKFVAGFLSGGLALISDALHSGSDFVSIITSWIGIKFAQKDADEKFQYGYYKAENLGSLIISFLILYASFEMMKRGYNKLFEVSDIKYPILALSVSAVDALVLFFFGSYEIKVGKEIGAQSLVAMGKENRTHILSSFAIFVGTLSAYLEIPYVEGIVTMAISLVIFEIGFSTLKTSVYALMDVRPDEDFMERIEKAIESVPGIEEYFDLKVRRSGPFILGEVKVGIRKSVDVNRSHEIADKVERAIKDKVEKVDSFIVHVEPFESEYTHIVIPVKQRKDMKSEIAETFGRAEYLMFVNIKKNNIESFYFIENAFKEKEKRIGLSLAQVAIDKKSEVLITPSIGDIAFHTLSDNLFDIYKVQKRFLVEDAINKFVNDDLKRLDSPTESKSAD